MELFTVVPAAGVGCSRRRTGYASTAVASPLVADARPIGIFDSGFGGLTVSRAVIDLLPGEDTVYFGDTGRYPYGPRELDEVAGFAHEIAAHLVADHDVKFLIVACNTASAAVDLRELETAIGVPVVGVIDPGARALVEVTETGRIGVIGTVGTIGSGAYQRAIAAAGRRRIRRADLRLRARASSSSSSGASSPAIRSRCWPSGSWLRSSRPTSTVCCSVARTTRTWRGRSGR